MSAPAVWFARVVAAYGLPGADRARAPGAAPAFGELLAVATREGMTGLLCRAIDAGVVDADGGQRERARRAHEDLLARDLRLERLAVRTSAILAAEGVVHRVLKGPVVARTAYEAPDLRSFRDVDVLVGREAFERAVRLLTAEGGTRRFGEPRAGFAARYTKGVCVEGVDGCQVDVHVTLAPGPFGLAIPVEELFGSPDTIGVGGVAVPVLGPVHRFLHACYHAALGDDPPRFASLRDVVELARRGEAHADAVLATARRWRGRAVVQRALGLAAATLGVPVPAAYAEWVQRYRPAPLEAAALRSSLPPAAGYARQAAAGLLLLPGARARLHYATSLLFPGREYLADREGSYLRRARRALGLARESQR